MQMARAEAPLLPFLAMASKAKKAVEIGGLFGYSALHIARGLSSGGRVYSLDLSQERQAIAKKILKKAPESSRITFIPGDAHQTLPSLSKKGPFDFIFIDADKAGYMDYLLWAEKNLKKGGLIAADNAFLFHTLYAQEPALSRFRKTHRVSKKAEAVLKAFNKRITSPQSPWRGVMIPTLDGLALALKVR